MTIRDLRLPRTSRLFARFFGSYAIILLLPFFIGAILYSSSVRLVEESATKSAQAILEQTRDIVDTRIAELDSIARQLTLSQRALSVLSMGRLEEGSPAHYGVWSFWSELPDYSLANSFISSFYIILRRAQLVISAREVAPDDPAQYEREFRYRDWDYERWRSFLFSRQHNHEFLPGASPLPGKGGKRGVYYVQSLPIESARNPSGAFVVFIDHASIAGLLKRLDPGSRGLVLIADGSGEVVASIAGGECRLEPAQTARLAAAGELASLERAGYIVSRAASDLAKWSYVSILPSETVLSEAHRVRDTALAALALGLALGLGAAAILARRSAAPIRAIARKLTGLSSSPAALGSRDELEYLGEAFDGLIADDEGLRAELELQSPVVRADLTRRLLLGLYGNEEEALALARSARVDLTGRSFAAAAVRIEGYREAINERLLHELKVVRAAIAEALRNAQNSQALPYEQEDSLVGVLFSFPRAAQAEAKASDGAERCLAQAEQFLRSVAGALAEHYRVRIAWALGSSAASLSELPLSYMRARRSLEASAAPASTRASPMNPRAAGIEAEAEEDSGPGEAPFWFPIEAELRLVAAIRGADAQALRSVLREAAQENLDERFLSERMFQDFASAFRVAVVRGFGAEGRNPKAPAGAASEIAARLALVEGSDRSRWFAETEGLLGSFLDSMASAKRNERRDLALAIAARIADVYADPSLTIYSLAREFDLSESTFYHFFRDAFGQSFADYLEGLRIREACSRLASGGEAIKDVAAAVGFASDTTFRRAFHRVLGSSPSEYARSSPRDE